jgi:hypothetical protein
MTKRTAMLFDGLLMLCKVKMASVTSGGESTRKYKLKERFRVRDMEVVDLENTAGTAVTSGRLRYGLPYTSDMTNHWSVRDGADAQAAPIVLCCRTREEKDDWLAALVWLQHKTYSCT